MFMHYQLKPEQNPLILIGRFKKYKIGCMLTQLQCNHMAMYILSEYSQNFSTYTGTTTIYSTCIRLIKFQTAGPTQCQHA